MPFLPLEPHIIYIKNRQKWREKPGPARPPPPSISTTLTGIPAFILSRFFLFFNFQLNKKGGEDWHGSLKNKYLNIFIYIGTVSKNLFFLKLSYEYFLCLKFLDFSE